MDASNMGVGMVGDSGTSREDKAYRIFLGYLRLPEADQVSREHVRDVFAAASGHRCENILLISGGSAETAFRLLDEHPPTKGIDALLMDAYGRDLSRSFGSSHERIRFTEAFVHHFGPIAHNAIASVMSDHRRWAREESARGDKIYDMIHDAVVAAYYCVFGFERAASSDPKRLEHLRALTTLIERTTIPFGIADAGKTLICLAK